MIFFILFLYIADVYGIQNNARRNPDQTQSHPDFHHEGTSNTILVEFRTTIDVHLANKLQGYGRSRSSKSTLVSSPQINYVTEKSPYYYNSYRKLHDVTWGRQGLEHLQVTTGLLPDVTVTVQPKRSHYEGLSRNNRLLQSVTTLTAKHKKRRKENDAIPVQSSAVIPRRRNHFREWPLPTASEDQKIYVNIELFPKNKDRRSQFIDSFTRTKVISNYGFKYPSITRDIQVKTDKNGKKKEITFPASPAIRDRRQQFPGQFSRLKKRYSFKKEHFGVSRIDPVTIQQKNKNVLLATSSWQQQFANRETKMNNGSSSENENSGLVRDITATIRSQLTDHKEINKNITYHVSSAISGRRMQFPGPRPRTDERSLVGPKYPIFSRDFTVQPKITVHKEYKKKIAFTVYSTIPSWRLQYPKISERFFEPEYPGILRGFTVHSKTTYKGHKKNITFSVSPAIPGWRLQFPGHPPRMNEINSEPEHQSLLRDTLLKTTGSKGENYDIAFPVYPAVTGGRLKFPVPPPKTDKRSSADPESFFVHGTAQKGENKVMVHSIYQTKRPATGDSQQQFPNIPGETLKISSTNHKHRNFWQDIPVTVQSKRTDHKGFKNNIAFSVSPAIPGWRMEYPRRSMREFHSRGSPRTDKIYSPYPESFTVHGTAQIGENKVTAVYQAKHPGSSDFRLQFSDRSLDKQEKSSTGHKYRDISRDIIPVTIQPKITDKTGRKKNIGFSVPSAIPGWLLQFTGHPPRMNQRYYSEPEYLDLSRDTPLKTTNKKGKNNSIAFPVSPAIPGWRLGFPSSTLRKDKRSSIKPEYLTVQGTDPTGENEIMAHSVYQAKLPATPDPRHQFSNRPVDKQQKNSGGHKYRDPLRHIRPVTIQPNITDQTGHKKDIGFSVPSAIPGWLLQFTGHPPRMNQRYSDPEYQDLSRDTPLKTIIMKGKNNNIVVPVSPAIPGWRLGFPSSTLRKYKISSIKPEYLTVQGPDPTGENKVMAHSVYQAKLPATPDSRHQFSDRPLDKQEKSSTGHKYRDISRGIRPVTIQPKITEITGRKKNIGFSVPSAIPGWLLQFTGHPPRMNQRYYSEREYLDLSRDTPLKTTNKKGKNNSIAFPVSPAIPGWRLGFPSSTLRKDKRSSIKPEYLTVQGTDPTGENKVMAYSVYQAKFPATPDSRHQFSSRPVDKQQKNSTSHKYRDPSRDIIPVTIQPKITDKAGHKKNTVFPVFTGHPPRMNQRYSGPEYLDLSRDTPLKTSIKKGKNNNIAFPVSPAIPGWRLGFPSSTIRMDKIPSIKPEYLTVQELDLTGDKSIKNNITFSDAPPIKGRQLQYNDPLLRLKERSADEPEYLSFSQVKTMKTTYNKGNKKNVSFKDSKVRPPAIPGWQQEFHDRPLRVNKTSLRDNEYPSLRDTTVSVHGINQKGDKKEFQLQQLSGHHHSMNEISMEHKYSGFSRNISFTEQKNNKKNLNNDIALQVYQTKPTVITSWSQKISDQLRKPNELTYAKTEHSVLSRDISFILQLKTTDQKGVKKYIPPTISDRHQHLPNKPGLVKEIFSTFKTRYTGLSGIPLSARGMNQREDKIDLDISVSPAIPGWQLQFPRPPVKINKKHFDRPEHAGLFRGLPVYAQSNTTFIKHHGKIIAYSVAPPFPNSRLESADQPPRKDDGKMITNSVARPFPDSRLKSSDQPPKKDDGKMITYSVAPPFPNSRLECPNQLPRKEDGKIIAYPVAPTFHGSRQETPNQPPKMNKGYTGELNYSDILSRDTPVTVQRIDEGDAKNIYQAEPPAIITWRPQYPELPAITNVKSSDEFPVLKEYLEKYPEGTMKPEETEYTNCDMNFAESIVRKRQKINLDVEVKVKMSVP